MSEKHTPPEITMQEQFIRNLYKGILKRSGDPGGIRHHREGLGKNPAFEDAAALLSAFVNCKEAAELRVSRNNERMEKGTV